MPSQSDPLQMDELIIRLLQARATSDEESHVREWLKAAPENERRHDALARLWSLTAAASATVEAGRVPDAEMLIRKAETQLHDTSSEVEALAVGGVSQERGRQSPAKALRRGPRTVATLKAAALAAAFVPVGFALAHLLGSDKVIPGPLSESEITTGAGEMTTIELAGGTSIRVGPRSRLRLSQGDEGLVADLNGRAFFGIKSDGAETFAVRTRHGTAFILGTRLEVRSEGEEFRVLVVDGAVRVAVGETTTDLLAGEMSRSLNGRPPVVFPVDDVYAHLEWMGNAMVFQATPLEKVIAEIERRYGVQVVLESPALADFTVTAAFTDQELGHVVAVICEIIGARCSIENGSVLIRE
jgi:transmembrane sensor